jgi:gamma-glutamyltranspeptidase/glutathione hydrolase
LGDDYNGFRMSMQKPPKHKVSVAHGKGAAASVSKEATELALEVLNGGGNAFDASFALAFALAVCHPQAGNIGGGGYVLYKHRDEAFPLVINYRERAPEGVAREDYINKDGYINPDRTAFGPLSVCVPGTVKAWFHLHGRYGRMEAKDLILTVADLASRGVAITEYQAQCLNRLKPKLMKSPESKLVYVKEEGLFKGGDLLKNPHLADTLATLAREGQNAFYRGDIAEQIVKEIRENGGCMTMKDLGSYEVEEVAPVSTEVMGSMVWSVPPEGGGAALMEILNILAREDFFELEPRTVQHYHRLAQACKMAGIDRFYYHGEIDAVEHKTCRKILEKQYADRLYGLIRHDKDLPAKTLDRLMHTGAEELFKGDWDNERRFGGKDTTHFSVLDKEGNAVSNSYTLNLRYGSKWSVSGAGFLLNGSIDAFSFELGRPNYFGVVGNRENLLAPRKRPSSNMSPTVVTRDKDVHMLLGTPGGPTIQPTVAAIIFSVLAGIAPEEAVNMARIHHQGLPDTLYKEKEGIASTAVDELEHLGYRVEDRNEPIGDVHGLFRVDGEWVAVSDRRREGYAGAC